MAKGWLDNFGKEDNYNDYQTHAPEGFQGDGYSNVGRNSSPAWGGQFQTGGKLKFLQPTDPKLPSTFNDRTGDYNSEVAISIGGENGEPAYLIPTFKKGKFLKDPEGEYKRTGEHLGGPFKTWQDADKWEKTIRHPAVEQHKSIVPYTYKNMQIGGVMPGLVGHMYDRHGAPSKGPRRNQTDVTDASAQNGQEMRYYQQGLDFQPKTISQNGDWLDKFHDEHPSVRSIQNDTMNRKIQEHKGKGKEINITQKDNVKTVTPKEIKKLSGRQQNELAQRQSEEQANKDWVQGSMEEAYKSPLMSPGYFTPEGAIIGGLESATKTGMDLNQGNYKGAALNALGVLPLAAEFGPELRSIKTSIAPELKQGLQTNGFLDIFKSKPKSEINWGNWNKEIPNNPQLMKEYNTIEQTSKANGSWMKYLDGSDFKGTPEQFIQMRHPNTQKYAGGIDQVEQMYKEPLYRGAHEHIVDFKNRDRNDYATFLTNNEKNAETYAGSDGIAKKYFHPDVDKEVEAYGKFYPLGGEGKYQLSFPQNLPVIEGRGNGNNWRFLDYNKEIDADGVRTEINRNNFEHNLEGKKEYQYDYPEDFNINKNYLSTDDYANYVKNNPTGIAKIKNVKDQMGYVEGIPANTVYAVDAEKVPIKSLMYNNGKFDMTNPNIYKAVVPGAIGLGAASQMEQKKDGGIIKDDNGYWNPDNWGKVVEIGSNDITMEGVDQPLLGVSDTGDTKLMKPGKNYKFKGKKVTEYPMAKNGLRQEQKGLQNLDNLTNFTNYNTKQPGGWLDTL